MPDPPIEVSGQPDRVDRRHFLAMVATTVTTRRRVPCSSIGPYRRGVDGHARGFRRYCCLPGKFGVRFRHGGLHELSRD